MATFDKLIQEIGARYHLGPKGRSLVQETLDLIARQPGGIGGFLDRYKAAGFAAEVASWVGRNDAVPLSGQEVEEALGSGVISEIADKAGVSQRFARTILGFAIPKIVGQLAQGVAIPSAIPVAASIPLSSSYAEEIALPGAEQIPPSSMGGSGRAPGLGRLLIPGACLLITLGVLGYAISSGRSGTRAAVQSAPVTAQNAPLASPTAPSPPARLAVSKPVASPPAPSIPARLALNNENGLIVYSGTVGDDAARTAITDSLKKVFGADKITGDLAMDQHAGQAGWTKDLKAALDNFKTPGSQALFEGKAVSVGGTIPDADRDRIISSLKSVLGPQFAVATLAGSGATKTAAASSALKSGFSGINPADAPNQPALDLPAIYFAASSAKVPSSGKVLLRKAAGPMKQLPAGTVVQISGYTDSAGNPTANTQLSQRRADAVRRVLVDAGINPAMLSAKGYGSSDTLANNKGKAERRSNSAMEDRRRNERRVEFGIVQQ
ncbi:MAG: OmpA family protein [Pseudomonadota bacterium]|nr:OmpA family protein [Pseudomonadota bacterium]